jgi:mannose/cellobiose epimerase-like protein (N-acyl-D-glucosamine 2-epimerase family)
MSAPDPFLADARATYAHANAASLRWMLERTSTGDGWLDTKLNSVTLKDYDAGDGLRGPDYVYGWIQGRGLEALAVHADFFAEDAPNLSMALNEAGRRLYRRLDALQQRYGHAYFCYDKAMRPVYPAADGGVQAQALPAEIYTYADAFVAKGLVAGSARYAPADVPRHLAYLAATIAAVEDGRFQMDELRPLDAATAANQPADFGPRMILLGAAGLLARLGLEASAAFAPRFIADVLARHFDAESGLLRNVAGADACNVGHAIEFVGFALDCLPADASPELIARLERILVASFRAGFIGPGIALSISIRDGQPLNSYCPWWSLPETIRAAALCFARSGDAEIMAIWQTAHAAFFETYWRGAPPVAYQTMNRSGPVDFVPATPDLDPGYHTGLSLLAAIRIADALQRPAVSTFTRAAG